MPNAVLSRMVEERESLFGTIDEILNTAAGDERDCSESERELIARHNQRIAAIDPQIAELAEIEERRSANGEAIARVQRSPRPTSNGEGHAPATTAAPQPVYRTFGEYARDQLILRHDGIAQAAGGRTGPAERIERHNQWVERELAHTLTTDIPGLMVPQHISEIMQVIDKSRPLVEASRHRPLTGGKLTWPKITSPRPTVGKQTTEKTETTSTKLTVALDSVTAETYLGAGNLSWQAVNWSDPSALDLMFDLFGEAYAQATETAAATVLEAAATATAIPVATDDVAGWLAAVATAAGTVWTASKHRANAIVADVMTGFKLAGMVSASSPVLLNSAGSFDLGSGQGNFGGLRLVLTPGLTADTIILGDLQSLLTAETPGAPVELRAVEVAIGGFEVGVIGGFVAKVIEPLAFVPLTVPAP